MDFYSSLFYSYKSNAMPDSLALRGQATASQMNRMFADNNVPVCLRLVFDYDTFAYENFGNDIDAWLMQKPGIAEKDDIPQGQAHTR